MVLLNGPEAIRHVQVENSGNDRRSHASIRMCCGRCPRLRERMGQVAGTLSCGEQQMRAMGRALMSQPRLLLMDEPSTGLTPRFVDQVFETIRAINGLGVTVLLVEQNALMALEIAKMAYVLQSGEVVLSGTGTSLMDSEAVREAYLG